MCDLDLGSVPNCIKTLNEFENILIQRAKAFQVITRMNTILEGHNKQRPQSDMIKKIKCRTFHLPLPLENTLAKLPNSNEAIIKDQELLIPEESMGILCRRQKIACRIGMVS